MVSRELKIRYKNSFFGFLWSMFNPLLTVAVLTFVFKYLNGNDTPNYSAYVLAAYLPYMFFQQAILDSAQSVLGNMNILKKIYFPREILPLSIILSNFVHLLLALLVFFGYLFVLALCYHDWSVFQWTVVFLPVALLINFFLVVGAGLLFSALNTFYEDVKYVLTIVLYLLFFLCPIMYFSENLYYTRGKKIYFLYHLDPVATMSMLYRKILLAPQAVKVSLGLAGHQTLVSEPPLPIDWRLVGVAAVVSVALTVYGYHVFNKLKWSFAERL